MIKLVIRIEKKGRWQCHFCVTGCANKKIYFEWMMIMQIFISIIHPLTHESQEKYSLGHKKVLKLFIFETSIKKSFEEYFQTYWLSNSFHFSYCIIGVTFRQSDEKICGVNLKDSRHCFIKEIKLNLLK